SPEPWAGCILTLPLLPPQRRFPDFSYITRSGRLTDFLDCVIISHFHLDHCGALPYFSEMVGYDGPIYMTQPTQAICPILLEDYRKIAVDKKGEANFFTSQMIKDCMKKVVAVHLHQTVQGLSVLSTKQMASEALRATFLVTSHPVGLAFLPGT
ncbi:CPSF3L, partial [Cervus elaphus hippelaphus]